MLRHILVIAILAPTIVFAQRGGGGGGGRGGGRGGPDMPNPGFGQMSKVDRIGQMLQLSKDQKKDLKTTFDESQKEAAPVHDQIAKARTAIAEAVAAGKSQDEIAKAVNAEAALQSQMAAIEIKAFVKVVQGLETDQQQRAGPLFMMMRGMFSGKNWNSE